MLEHENSNIIHISKWAVTKRNGTKIHKMFLYDNIRKINKEIGLLKLSTATDVKLFYDLKSRHWISETDYHEFHDLFDNGLTDDMIAQLKRVFMRWEQDSRYRALVPAEWSTVTVPWYCDLLRHYIPDSERLTSFLLQTKENHFIHGDFSLSNVKKNRAGEIIVLDFENAGIGPLLWDETTLVYSAIEEEEYIIAKQLFDCFSCTADMLITIASIRLALSRKKGQNEIRRMKALRFALDNYNNL